MYSRIKIIFKLASKCPDSFLIISLQFFSGFLTILGLPLLAPVLELINDPLINVEGDPLLSIFAFLLGVINIEVSLTSLLIILSFFVISGFILDARIQLMVLYRKYDLDASVHKRLLNGYLKVDWPWILNHDSGDMNHALFAQTAQWSQTIFLAVRLIINLIQIATYLAIALYMSVYSSLIALIVLSLLFLLNIFISEQIKTISFTRDRVQREFAEVTSSIQQNKKYIKSSSLNQSVISLYFKIVRKIILLARKIALRDQIQRAWIQCGVFIVLVLLIAFNKQLDLGYGALVVMLASFSRLLPSLTTLSAEYASFSAHLPVFQSLNEMMSTMSSSKESHGDKSYKRGSLIKFQNVSFSYNEKDDVLKDVNFKIPENKVTAIVGSSGSGKSTILDLTLGLLRTKDLIMYGEINNHQIDYLSLRENVAYVSQETTLFSGTLKYNLKIANQSVSDEDIQNAINSVHLTEFVESNKDGVDIWLGENGINLSGGQRQRVGLARALLTNPDILILDEATSSLDKKTESKIFETIMDNLKGKLTIIIVTHRVSSLKDIENIIVLDDGRVGDCGTFEKLSNENKTFRMILESKE